MRDGFGCGRLAAAAANKKIADTADTVLKTQKPRRGITAEIKQSYRQAQRLLSFPALRMRAAIIICAGAGRQNGDYYD